MPVFQSKKFRPKSYQNTIGAWYRASVKRNSFLYFGLPFMLTILSGSFIITPATAVRYELHDRKVQQMSEEERLGLGKDRRRVDMNEEYYRLATKDLENWENKRVKRLPGEHDGVS